MYKKGNLYCVKALILLKFFYVTGKNLLFIVSDSGARISDFNKSL